MPKPIKYDLPDPAYQAYTWILQDEHGPGAQPPITWDGGPFAAGQPPAGEVPMRVQVHGFPYARPEASGQNPFGSATAPAKLEDLTSWREVWPAQIDAFAEQMRRFDPAAVPAGEWRSTLGAHDRELMRIFSGVHLATVISGHMAVASFTEAYVERFGEEARPETLALLQGFPNLSLERAAALWDLSRIALGDSGVMSALQSGEPMPPSEAGLRFQELVAQTLARFGHTNNIGGVHKPTWAEDPSIPLELVKTYARLPEERGPRATAAEQAARRRELEGKVAATGDQQFQHKLLLAQQYLPNLEDHNLICDQRMGAAVRARWLAVGAYLRDRGLAAADDVFYYKRREVIETLEGGPLLSASLIQERRDLMESVTVYPPPPFLGRAPERAREVFALEAKTGAMLRGVAASAGTYTGRARIIETLDDAWRLQEGDVLVARMTSPPWTPLFATIGALVVNTGGALSHGAVVAREFGIPAVVGATYATTLIKDGATVTVDGTHGVVTVED